MSFTNESLAMAEEEINFTGGDDLSRDEESTGGGSFVSGVVADGNIVTFRDLVDLTAPTSCRVIMTQRGPRRVCGNRFGACSRNSHNDIAARDAHRRAPASFYLAYQTRQGGLDGLFDSSYSAEDAIRMRDSEVEEQVARLRELEGSAGSSPVVVETVNSEEVLEDSDLQGDSYSPPRTPPSGSPDGGGNDSPSMPQEGGDGPPPNQRGTGQGGGSGSGPPAPAPAPPGPPTPEPGPSTLPKIYGLVNLTTLSRELEEDFETVKLLIQVGWAVQKVFSSLREATAWKLAAKARTPPLGTNSRVISGARNPREGPPHQPSPPPPANRVTARAPMGFPTSINTAPTPRSGPGRGVGHPPPEDRVYYGMENPDSMDRVVARARAEADFLRDSGYAIRKLFYDLAPAEEWAEGMDLRIKQGPRGQGHTTRIGPDQSTDKGEVFGVRIDDMEEMDSMCLPVGTPPSEADDMYDTAVDVMALPGGFKSAGPDDDDEQGDMAKAFMSMAMGRRETGLHMRFNATNQNGLRQIKGQADLADFVESVHEAWDHAQDTMRSQVYRRMYRAGHANDMIESYLLNGVMPRIVRDTYQWYSLFLTTLTGHVNRMGTGEAWATSVPGTVLELHSKALMLIRSSSASYREMVLRNYAYMRNQARDNFWNNKLSRKMAIVNASLMSQV